MRALAVCLLALAACGADPLPPVEPEPDPGACGDDVPVITWESFGQGFVTTYCQGCHATSAVDRQGAPEQVVFDEEIDVLTWKGLVLEVAASEAPTMPPGGGPLPEDRDRLAIWLSCFAE